MMRRKGWDWQRFIISTQLEISGDSGRLADWEVPSSDPGPGPLFSQLIVDRSADGLTGYVSAGRLLRNDDDDKRRGRDKTKESAYARKDARPATIGLTPGLSLQRACQAARLALGRPGDFSVLIIYFVGATNMAANRMPHATAPGATKTPSILSGQQS